MSDNKTPQKVFVYTELQISASFDTVPWEEINELLKTVQGFVRKTWLSGMNTKSVGGMYEFSSLESAQDFAWNIFPKEAKKFGVSFITKLFNGDIVEEASRGANSPHYN